MAHGNNSFYNNYNRNRYSKGNYQSARPYYGNNQNQQQQYKKTGFKVTQVVNNGVTTFIGSGWKKTRNGLLSIYARPYKKTKVSISHKGHRHHNLFVEITNTTTGQVQKHSGMFNETTKYLIIEKIGWLCTPNGSGVTRSGKRVTGTITRIKK